MESEAQEPIKTIAKKIAASEIKRWSWGTQSEVAGWVSRVTFICPNCKSRETRHPEGTGSIPESFILGCSNCERILEIMSE